MLKIQALLLFTLLTPVSSPVRDSVPELIGNIAQMPGAEDFLINTKQLDQYTFSIPAKAKPPGWTRDVAIWGKGFIAGGKVWTAEHVLEKLGTPIDEAFEDGDVACLGEAAINGLDFALFDPRIGDFLYYRTTTRGLITMVVVEVKKVSGGTYLNVFTDLAVIPGDSGSPILNNKGEVVGLVSAKYYPRSYRGAWNAGMIALITKEDKNGS